MLIQVAGFRFHISKGESKWHDKSKLVKREILPSLLGQFDLLKMELIVDPSSRVFTVPPNFSIPKVYHGLV